MSLLLLSGLCCAGYGLHGNLILSQWSPSRSHPPASPHSCHPAGLNARVLHLYYSARKIPFIHPSPVVIAISLKVQHLGLTGSAICHVLSSSLFPSRSDSLPSPIWALFSASTSVCFLSFFSFRLWLPLSAHEA